MTRLLPVLFSVLMLGLGSGLVDVASGAADGELTFSAGADYTSGDYGESEDTDIAYFPFSIQYERSSWIAKVTVPYLIIRGPGGVTAADGGPIIVEGGDTDRNTESGLGDVVASLAYVIDSQSELLPIFELTGKVKFPTADEDDGLGTGEADYAAQIDVSKTFGRLTPFVTAGYRFRGGLENGLFASLGLGLALTSRVSAGLIYDYSEPATSRVTRLVAPGPTLVREDVDDSHELVPYVNVRLTDSSPDFGGGASLAVSF